MRLLLWLLLGAFTHVQTAAQSIAPDEASSLVGDDFSLFLKLTGHTLTAPVRWNGCDWLAAGGVIAGTGAASLLDDEVYTLMERHHNNFNGTLSNVSVEYGSGVTGAALTGGFYVVGLAFDNTWLRETSVLMASALIVSVASELTLKLVVGRARPYTGFGQSTFKPFNGKADFLPFPLVTRLWRSHSQQCFQKESRTPGRR